MSNILETVNYELKKQSNELQRAQIELEKCPPGFLRMRKRIRSVTYYQVIGNREINITDSPEIVTSLIRKKINEKVLKAATKNIAVLKKVLAAFQPNNYSDLMKSLPEVYQQANNLLYKTANATQNKFLYKPETHKHATTAGIYVRSKSEVIIANALTSYGISFSYEELFHIKTIDGKRIYPDFKIKCADGYIIIWEHWGLVSDIEYCIDQAYKLNAYNSQKYVLGENLIITMDNCNGGCNAQKIDEIIRTTILPHMGFQM